MPKLRNGNNGDSNPGSLDCESGILPTELPRSTYLVRVSYAHYICHRNTFPFSVILLFAHQISERLFIFCESSRWMTYGVLEFGRQEPGVLFLKLHCQVARGGRCKTQQDVCKLQQTWVIKGKVKVKVCFYIAQHPVRRTAQSALYVMPPLADLFILTITRLLREAF